MRAVAIVTPKPLPARSQVDVRFVSAEVLDDIAVIAATPTTERTIEVALPVGAVIKRVILAAIITAMNNSENAQKVDVDVQGRVAEGSWSTFFSQDAVFGFGAVDGATVNIVALQDVSALVDAEATYGFRLQITQSAAFSVRYTTQYLLIVTYSMG